MPGSLSYPEDFTAGDFFMEKTAEHMRQTLGVSTVLITYYQAPAWKKSAAGTEFPKMLVPNILYREVVQENMYIEIEDCFKHPSYKFINLKMNLPAIRFIGCHPIVDETKKVIGAFTLIDGKARTLSAGDIAILNCACAMTHYHLKTPAVAKPEDNSRT